MLRVDPGTNPDPITNTAVTVTERMESSKFDGSWRTGHGSSPLAFAEGVRHARSTEKRGRIGPDSRPEVVVGRGGARRGERLGPGRGTRPAGRRGQGTEGGRGSWQGGGPET